MITWNDGNPNDNRFLYIYLFLIATHEFICFHLAKGRVALFRTETIVAFSALNGIRLKNSLSINY